MSLSRTLRCAMPTLPNDDTAKFEADLTSNGYPWAVEIVVSNAKVYRVAVPDRQADVFATFVNSNFGKML